MPVSGQPAPPQPVTRAGTWRGPPCAQPVPGGSSEDRGPGCKSPTSPSLPTPQAAAAAAAACGKVTCPLHHSITTSAFWPCPSPLQLTLSQLCEYLLITSHFPCAASFRTKEVGFSGLFRKGTAGRLMSGHLGWAAGTAEVCSHILRPLWVPDTLPVQSSRQPSEAAITLPASFPWLPKVG